MAPALQIIATIGLLLAAPAGCALLLRQAGAPGWPVLGGIIAGLLLGPTIFGRLAPSTYESLLVGGVEQRESLDRLVSRRGADVLAAQAADLDAEAFEQLRMAHERERVQLENELQEARWDHQRPLRVFTVLCVAAALIGAVRFAVPRPPHGQHIVSALNIGLWSAAVPGACAYVAAVRWWGWSPSEGAIIAAAVMIGPWALTPIDRKAANRAEYGGAHLIQTAGRCATLPALAATAWGFTLALGLAGLAWFAALAAIALGWAIRPATASPRVQPPRSPAVAALIKSLLLVLILPALAALAAVRVELFAHFAFWPILILLILSGDGRWLGAFIGAMTLGGRDGMRTMRLVLGSMACGPTQLAVVALAANMWILPHEAVMALVLGAAVIEATAPLRRSMAQRLAEAEEWELR